MIFFRCAAGAGHHHWIQSPKTHLPKPIPLIRSHIQPHKLLESQKRFYASPVKTEGTTVSKAMKIALYLLVGATALAAMGFYVAGKKESSEQTFIQGFDARILDAIEHAQEAPGLNKEEIANTWRSLVRQGVIEVSDTDKDVRPGFVGLQGFIEDALSRTQNNEVRFLRGIIHTPMPATPLCTKGEISKDLVAPEIENDPKRVFTVKVRTTIVRDFLQRGGHLHIIYPKDGLSKRTEEQQKIYMQELDNYPDHLFDQPLNCSSIPEELIGATYVFTDKQGEAYAFAIKMTQAKDPKEIGHFGLWFGSLQNPKVSTRVHAVLDFIKENEKAIDILPQKGL